MALISPTSSLSIAALSIALLTGSLSAVCAEVLPADDPAFGEASITFDTETQLEWLDLSFSLGRSYNDVSGEFGPGGDFEGFRHASAAELVELWEHAEVPEIDEGYSGTNYAPVSTFCDLVGFTGSSSQQSYGMLEDPQGEGRRTLAYCIANSVSEEGVASSCCSFLYENGTNPLFGHWLVRLAVTSSSSGLAPGLSLEAPELHVFPNPSLGGTHIELRAPHEGPVRVEIVGVDGRRVSTLFDGSLATGAHRIEWDGLDATGGSVPAGVYWVRVTTPQAQVSRAVHRVR